MGLRIVYGRAGTGKSSFCYQEIAKNIQEKEKIYIITPEQFSFTAEKKLMDALPMSSAMNAEVLTFERMAYRVMQEVGGAAKTMLSQVGKSMLLYYLLDQNKEKLTFLGKTDKNIDLIMNTMTELKKHNITVEQIKESESSIENPYLQYKCKDISILYEAFQNHIQGQYMEENDRLTILADQLEKTNLFQDARIYIEEFVGYTPQEYRVIEKLLKQAKEITITICADKLTPQIEYIPEMDLFYSNRMTKNRLIDIAKNNHIPIEEEVYLDKPYRYQTEELKHLEKYLYESRFQQYSKNAEHMHLFLASNPYSEIEQVAKNIIKLVRDKGYRYKDIAIISKNIEVYASLSKAIFAQYDIPVFIDEKKDLSDNLLVRHLLSVLEIFSKNWSSEAVFGLLKNGLVSMDKKEISALENYCIQWGITRNKWYKEDWNYDEKADEMNQLRKRIVEPILTLKEKLKKRKTAGQITKALYEFLEENEIPKRLEEKIKKLEDNGNLELASEYETSWKLVMQVLDEMVLILEEEHISFERYLQILKMGFSQSSLGKIPATLDQVIMGDIERSRSHKVKVIFIIGLNDGMFPSFMKQEGFLDDENREELKQIGIEMAKGTKERLYEENFNIYKAMTTAEEELYFSYSSTDYEGSSLRASTLISKIKKLYPSLQEESDMNQEKTDFYTKKNTFEELLNQLRKLEDGEELNKEWEYLSSVYLTEKDWKEKLEKALEGMAYTNLPKPVEQENIEKLYGDVLKTSVSKLEQYQSCPFSFYLKYGLGIEEKQIFQVESMDTGSFMHDIIDTFFSMVQEKELALKELSEEQIQCMLNQIIDDKLLLKKNYILTSTAKYQVLVNRLRRLLIKAMKYIIQTITESDFELLGHEVEFKEKKEYPPIRLSLGDGRKIEIIGKIDRIDVGKKEDKTYLRIIDYKSSIKNIDLNEVVAGLQIQLLTYLDAVTKAEDMIPAGVLYFHLIDPIIKAKKNMTEEEIEEEIKKKFKMQGLILADVNVIKMMDKTLEKGASNKIPAYLDKDGNISKKFSSAISKEQFEELQHYIHQTIKQIAKEILSGKIDIHPYYSEKKKTSPCEYCKYHAICQFDPALPGNCYQYIPNQDKEILLEKLKKKD